MIRLTFALSLLAAVPMAAEGTGDKEAALGMGVLLAPPEDHRLSPGQGTDSIVGRITGEGYACDYDLGRYSNPLDDWTLVQMHDAPLLRIVKRGADQLGLHAPALFQTGLGPTRLTVTCTARPDRFADLRAMFLSLRVVGR